jgi:hypothetical protein
MKNGIKELTEGMQRLCAIANRIVAHGDEVSPIERDLLLEDLRKLYDVALCLGAEESGERRAESGERRVAMPDDEILSSTVMATMAAMAPAPVAEAQDTPTEAEKPAPVVVEKPAPAVETQRAASPKETEDTPASGETHASLQEEKVLPAEETVAPVEETAAPAEETVAAEPEPAPMPAMEELESNGNSLLFDEVIIDEPAPAVEEEPAPAVETSPKETEDTPAIEETNNTPAIEETAAPAESPKVAVEPEHKAAGTQASLLDYLKRPVEEKPTVRTLGESLGGAESAERRVESVLTKKVSDLRTVININDKFSFMSELFHNNMKAYNDFILRLNAIDTRDEALLCVSEVSAQYHWDESSLAVQSFYKVFDKKF